jgi:hypothetical protein
MGWKDLFKDSTVMMRPDIAPSPPETPEVQVVEKVVEQVPDHTHEWDLTSKTYAAPRSDIQGTPETLLEKAFFGVTTLLWECAVCQSFRREEVLGTDESQLEVVLANAEKLGPQYLERESGIFIVAKWQAPAVAPPQQGQNIPLR